MTIQGAMNELANLLNADDIPIYYKGGIKKVIETIDDYIDGKDDYVKRKTENGSEKPNNFDDLQDWKDKMWSEAIVTEPQTERIKTLDYCDICNHKGCDNCIANNLDDYCVPSGYEPITQTETQNSNLIFEKRTMRDCYNCKKYETEGECIECHYEPKDECAKEYEELGLKELKELIKADRKTENSSEKPNNCEHITEDGVTCAKYPACDDCPDNLLNKVKGSERSLKGSEIPNNCTNCECTDDCSECKEAEHGCKDEPTISKMEQVDKPQNGYQTFNGTSVYVSRLEDDGQTEKGGCTNCDGKDLCNNAFTEISQYCGAYEPQAVLTARCLNCHNAKACKENNWQCCRFEPIKDEPQTYVINPQEPTNDDKCFECDDFFTCGGQCNKVEDEPQKIGYCNECKWYGDKQVCGRCRSRNLYAPKDEPQTDCAWR